MNNNDQDILTLDENDERRFKHAAGGYGVEVHGSSPEDREAMLQKHLNDPLVTVDGQEINSSEDLVERALIEMGADEDEVKEIYNIGGIELRRALADSGNSLAILHFDAMGEDVRKAVAQMMKGVAEQTQTDEIMFGYTSEDGGELVRAESDLSMRVLSWGLEGPGDA
jgi:hypothetical protein